MIVLRLVVFFIKPPGFYPGGFFDFQETLIQPLLLKFVNFDNSKRGLR